MATEVMSLSTLVQAYSNSFQERSRQVMQKRDALIPKYKGFVTDFLNGGTLAQFRDNLSAVYQDTFWSAKGGSFMLPINRLAANHATSNSQVEWTLRVLLTGLNANTLGQRIEQCYQWLIGERTRLINLNKTGNQIATP
jgi:hypothetical protein